MVGTLFCGSCGAPRVPGDRFCPSCGRNFDAGQTPYSNAPPMAGAPSQQPPGSPVSTPNETPASDETPTPKAVLRLWLPWILVVLGLIMASYFGSRAYSANLMMERLDTTSPIQSVRGLSWLLETLGLPSPGAVIDPRNNALYGDARRDFTQSLIVAILGLVIAAIGIAGALRAKPQSRPLSNAPSLFRLRPPPVTLLGLVVAAGLLFVSLSWQTVPGEVVATRTTGTGTGVTTSVTPPTQTAITLAPVAVVKGITVPQGQPIPPTPTPAVVFYRSVPYGPVKIEAGQVQPVRFTLDQGTRVAATVTVTFNNRLSNATGTPDIDIEVRGPAGTIATYPQTRNGFQLAFQAPIRGEYTVDLSNARSRVNAKQVALQFLQP